MSEVAALLSAQQAPQLPDYQQRVLDEHNELTERLGKLNAFIASPGFDSLEFAEKSLLVMQSGAMQQCANALELRTRFWWGTRQ